MIKEVYFLDFYNSLIEGNKYQCEKIVEELLNQKTDIKDIYVEIYQKSLYRIGSHWEESRVSIGEEHLATQIIEGLINKYSPRLNGNKTSGKKVLIACIDKEFHKLGAKMAADIFEINGWEAVFLGASTPTKEIVKFIGKIQPEIVGLSFNFYINTLRFLEVIDHIKRSYPDQKIIVGGQGVKDEKEKLLKKYPDIFYFESVYELDEFLKKS
jgi:MerR family transcriptional regulator, light-induced transcriptional regulator